MTAVTVTTTTLKMSSLDIASCTGKRHPDVLRDIRKMLTDIYGEGDQRSFASIYSDAYGREQTCFMLDEEHTLTLLTGYDAKARHRVTTEWLRMKQGTAPLPALNDPATLRALLLDYTENMVALEAKIEAQAPLVAVGEAMAVSEGSETPREAAKCIGITQTLLLKLLIERRWCYRGEPEGHNKSGRLRAYSTRIKQGLLEERMVDAGFSRDGVAQSRAQVYLTTKGMARMARIARGFDETEYTHELLRSLCIELAKVVGSSETSAIIKRFAPMLDKVSEDQYDELGAALSHRLANPF
jgi:hypothetical protein